METQLHAIGWNCFGWQNLHSFIILYYTIYSPSSHEVLQEGSKFQMQQVFTEEMACVTPHSM
jgi:hypothetical protein